MVRLARENPRWGYLRTVGELRKLGVTVSKTSVATVLGGHRLRPAPRREGPTWSQFLSAQAKAISAADLVHVDAVLLRRYYGLFVIELESRVVHLLAVTANPAMAWVVQVARNFCSDLEHGTKRFRFLIADRQTKFPSVDRRGVQSQPDRGNPRSDPLTQANASAERWVRTVRGDCLDDLLIYSKRHLESVLGTYIGHYDGLRSHHGLGLRPADPLTVRTPSPPAELANICRRGILGALLNKYYAA
jgi:hypothetical protein